MSEKYIDSLFAQPMGMVPEFAFDASVAAVFSDMIQRSVPGYSTVVAVSGVLAERFSTPGTRLYDLGCSLGATSLAMAHHAAKEAELIAIDSSPAMVDQLKSVLAATTLPIPVTVVCENIEKTCIQNASVVALNYTLQFVAQEKRSALIQRIYRGMVDGGILILSEKIAFQHEPVNALFVDLHHEFKRANGYSALEISQKREAIENVLIPESLVDHKKRLLDCGFQRVETWFQCLNFASLLAFK